MTGRLGVSLGRDGLPREKQTLNSEFKALSDWILSDGTRVPAQSKLRMSLRRCRVAHPKAPGEDSRGRRRRTPSRR